MAFGDRCLGDGGRFALARIASAVQRRRAMNKLT